MATSLTDETWRRYLRQFSLQDWGIGAYDALKGKKVLVLGAGGIGSALLPYLAGAGVGSITVVDGDRVELSNLHRQVLYTAEDIGLLKAEAAVKRLNALNHLVHLEAVPYRLDASNAEAMINDCDLVCDGTDNTATRFVVNDACVTLGKTLVWGAASGFTGQVSVFNAPMEDGQRGPNLRTIYEEEPSDVIDCVDQGVLGPVPGITGSIMAAEALNILVGNVSGLSGKILVFDARNMDFRVLNLV